jgi:hypothetical protein
MKLLAGSAALLCMAAAAPRSEPYFGHRGEACPVPDIAGPAIGEPAIVWSPVDRRRRHLIGRFEAAAAAHRSTRAFVDPSQLSVSTRSTCEAAAAKLRRSGGCRPTPLFLLGDGEIREEWVCGGQMVYLLFYTIERGRITNLWAMDPDSVPPVIDAVPSPG